MQDHCPRCGTERIGAFRYCRSCQFDFDTLGADAGAPPIVRPVTHAEVIARAPAADGRFPARGVLAVAFALVVGVAGLSPDAVPISGSLPSAFSTAIAIPQTEKQVAAASATTPPAGSSATAKPATGPSGTTTTAEVVRVIDGDSILVAFGGRRYEVQYLGLATPPTIEPQALAANTALVSGRTVVLEADVSQTDGSGRLLRYVWLQEGSGWTLVNLELVRLGFATVATHSPDRKYADGYAAAEGHARARHLGWWGPAAKAKPTPKAEKPKPPKGKQPPVRPVPSGRH